MEDSETLKKAEKEIERLGLPDHKKPYGKGDDLEWPRNIGELSPDELAEHMSWWTGWAAHVRVHVARAATNSNAYSETHNKMVQARRYKSAGDYKSVTELKAAIDQMPDVQKAKALMLEAEATYKLLQALLEGYESKYKTISREIARRGADFDDSSSKFVA